MAVCIVKCLVNTFGHGQTHGRLPLMLQAASFATSTCRSPGIITAIDDRVIGKNMNVSNRLRNSMCKTYTIAVCCCPLLVAQDSESPDWG